MDDQDRLLIEVVGAFLFLIVWLLGIIAWKISCLHRDYEVLNAAHETVKMHRRAERDGLANYDK